MAYYNGFERNGMERHGLDSSDLGWGQVAGCGVHGPELSGSTKSGEFIHKFRN
jgi:hypothetical protein